MLLVVRCWLFVVGDVCLVELSRDLFLVDGCSLMVVGGLCLVERSRDPFTERSRNEV